MSAFDNVVGGKLKLKGKALDVKSGSIKKKKKQKKHYDEVSESKQEEKIDDEKAGLDGNADSLALTNIEDDSNNNDESDKSTGKGKTPNFADYLTPAEKRYIEQREQLDIHKYSKMSKNSHRDRLDDFNQYLANLSEHYDIPKVGPG